MARRISKPVGVYVLTILIVLGLGLFQFLMYLADISRTDEGVPFLIVFLSFSTCAFSAAAAVWTFYGDNLARIVLLACVTINVLWFAFLIVTAIAYAPPTDLRWLNLVTLLFRPAFWFGLTWWYFTRPHVVAYYRQQSELESNA